MFLVMSGRQANNFSMHTVESETAEEAFAEHSRKRDPEKGAHPVVLVVPHNTDMRRFEKVLETFREVLREFGEEAGDGLAP